MMSVNNSKAGLRGRLVFVDLIFNVMQVKFFLKATLIKEGPIVKTKSAVLSPKSQRPKGLGLILKSHGPNEPLDSTSQKN